MKRLTTLLLAVGMIVTANAQTSREEARKVVLGEKGGRENTSTRGRDVVLGGGNDSRTYPRSTKDAQINRINREYDAKIQSIRNNRTLSAAEKEKIIRDLERDRAREIREVNKSYEKSRKKDKQFKSNRGKHKGWTKGKGNKHKDRG